MPDDATATATAITTAATPSALNVPEETRAQFPDIIPLVEKSPSMTPEERQYWIDVLPIMTGEQIQNLRDILANEKKQIDEANQAYAKGVQKEKEKVAIDFNESAYKAKREAIKVAEKAHETEEVKSEDQLLQEIEKMTV